MLAGISEGEACVVVGHDHATHLYELTKALEQLGCSVKSLNRFERFPMRPEVETALVRCRDESGRSHWQVWHLGVIYCPAEPMCRWPAVSYVEVTPVT